MTSSPPIAIPICATWPAAFTAPSTSSVPDARPASVSGWSRGGVRPMPGALSRTACGPWRAGSRGGGVGAPAGAPAALAREVRAVVFRGARFAGVAVAAAAAASVVAVVFGAAGLAAGFGFAAALGLAGVAFAAVFGFAAAGFVFAGALGGGVADSAAAVAAAVVAVVFGADARAAADRPVAIRGGRCAERLPITPGTWRLGFAVFFLGFSAIGPESTITLTFGAVRAD